MDNVFDIFDLLPERTYVKLRDTFRKQLIDLCIDNAGGVNKLANKLGIPRQKIYQFKRGWLRISYENLLFFVRYSGISLDKTWDEIDGFAHPGGSNTIKPPRYIDVNENLLWLMGIRAGDRAETETQIGICNSDISILKKFYNILLSYNAPKSSIYLYVYLKDEKNKSDVKKRVRVFSPIRIKYYCRKESNFYCLLQYNNSFFHKIIYLLEKNNIEELPLNLKSAFLQGFADAEAHVDIRGEIIFTQKANKEGKRNIRLIQKILDDFDIKYKIRERDGLLRLFTLKECIKRYRDIIGFSSVRKRKELECVIQIRSKSYDKRNIENDILKMSQKEVTQKEIAFSLKSKRSKIRLYIRDLESKGKIKIIKNRPLTVISVKEAPHDSLLPH